MERRHKPIIKFQDEYRFLSNFYRCTTVGHFGLVYPSSEHAYVSFKTTKLKTAIELIGIQKPGDVKKAGRLFDLPARWEEQKIEHMCFVVRSKFFSHPAIAYKLVRTGDALLIEGNFWHDNEWGLCLCPNCKVEGKNYLGKILMNVRNELVAIK